MNEQLNKAHVRNSGKPILEVKDLRVDFTLAGRPLLNAVRGASFRLEQGKTLCVVGESGSGKSVTARALMQLVQSPGVISGGNILYRSEPEGEAVDIARIDPGGADIRALRGREMGMIFQEPMASMSPIHTVGDQVGEGLRYHFGYSEEQANERVCELLSKVGLPDPQRVANSYAFQLSGGMLQRAMIALALACEPKILIADEPTTALDVTTQAEVLKLIKSIQIKDGLSVMFITHDMGVVAEIADYIAVMYQGEVIETGTPDEIFHEPQHAYTIRLIESAKKLDVTGSFSATEKRKASETPVLDAHGVSLTFQAKKTWLGGDTPATKALDNVGVDLFKGECLGIVGESGSGKTTLGRALMGIHTPDEGRAIYRGLGTETNLCDPASFKDGSVYRDFRMIFQDPYSSLNPRMTVEQIIAEPMKLHKVAQGPALRERVAELLEQVELSPDMMTRYPHAFSGGQRQRIGIARAIAVNPKVVIADEATSALDGSIRAQVLDLLLKLRDDLDLSFIFIGHDIGVVRYFCDRIAVMNKGRIVEIGSASQICDDPQHAYTQKLLSAIPSSDPRKRRLVFS